ncbi:ABC transporter permease [Candidatus Stoquefichus massiliensis]|uniref:ABC transporter permease n=1 Tax=Candidatus Stoquefichus massiliensis TaxID=1470350 RepID=UPI0004827BBA|nr:ABC transporter permease [Candidatus Stoquefichus massiliensis]
MKQFFLVIKFELETMMRKKSYLLSIVLIALAAFVLLSMPRFFNDKKENQDGKNNQVTESKDKDMLIYDNQGILSGLEFVEQSFPDYNIALEDDLSVLKNKVEDGSVDAGIELQEPLKFVYHVKNSSLNDRTAVYFQEVLQQQYQVNALKELNYDALKVNEIYHSSANYETNVLGTDGVNNYFYTYILIFVLYMMILLYGNQIAVSVASEKSNRAVEILVTSCSPNAMIFGKVIAGAIAGAVQTILILGSCLIAYHINADVWNHVLDPFLNIPTVVWVTFALFGIFGYLLFSFLFGAIGALCSKVEEVNGATMPIQLLIIAVFFISFITLQNPNDLLSTIVSYVPLTSWMCMFINVALGSVTVIEIIISLVILVLTTFAIGMIGAKLYRRGTLSYGNSMKLTHLFKMMKQKN